MGLSIEVEYVTDMQKIMEYGVMSMPALVVNEKVMSMGKVLKSADIEKLLCKCSSIGKHYHSHSVIQLLQSLTSPQSFMVPSAAIMANGTAS